MKHAADAVHVCRLQMKTWVKKKRKQTLSDECALVMGRLWGNLKCEVEDRRVEGDATERGEGWSASLCAWKRTSFAKKKWVFVRMCVCVRVCFHSRRCHAVWANGSPLRPSTACCRRHHPCCTQPASCQRLRHHSRWCQEPACPLISAEQMSLNCPPPHPLGNFTTTTRSRRHPNSQPSQRAKQATC